MKNNNRSRIFIELAVLSALLATNVAFASTSATVAATVTLQNVSVTVADGSVAYGTLATNTSNNTVAGTGGMNANAGDTQTATNAGNVAEDLSIKGQNSANWTLGGSPGTDTYVEKFCTGSCGTYASPTGANFNALTTSYASLASNVASSGTQTFDLLLTTPTSSTFFSAQSVDVTVLAAAH